MPDHQPGMQSWQSMKLGSLDIVDGWRDGETEVYKFVTKPDLVSHLKSMPCGIWGMKKEPLPTDTLYIGGLDQRVTRRISASR